MISPQFAWVAAVLPLAGFASYIRDTLRGRSQPNRVSWFLWGLAPLIAFAAEIVEGASPRIALVTFSLGCGSLLVVVASFANRNAYWRLTLFDFACGGLSLLALILWLITGKGNLAITLTILADALAAMPTIAKSYSDPESESVTTYACSCAASVIALLAIQDWRFANYGFPLYVAITCAVIVTLIALPRRRKLVTKSSPLRSAATEGRDIPRGDDQALVIKDTIGGYE